MIDCGVCVSDLLEFIRFKVCIYAVFLGLSGYLLFNPVSANAFFLVVMLFLGTGGVYSANNLTDTQEDFRNRGKTNVFVKGRIGLPLSVFLSLASVALGYCVSIESTLFMTLAILVGVSYSFARVKNHLLLKNVFTGFGVSVVFIAGAVANGIINAAVLYYYVIFSVFIFISSIISDIRDMHGDGATGIRTLPVSMGDSRTVKIVEILILAFSASLLFSGRLLIVLPFALSMLFFVNRNRPALAHDLSGYSLMFLVIWLAGGG